MNPTSKRSVSRDPVVVWIVEDNDVYRRSTRQLLDTSEGYECGGEFHRCEDAIDKLRSGEAPSVILLDIGLPGMTGIQGIPQLNALSPSTKILILTVHEEYDKVFDAICAGASGYLLKSTAPDGIIGAISDVMAGGAPMNAQIARETNQLKREELGIKVEEARTKRDEKVRER